MPWRHCGNRFLAEHYEKLGARVWLVPTSIDTDVWRPSNKEMGAKWTIGWMGSSANLMFLLALEQPLADFLAQYHDCRLLVVCDRRPSFKKLTCDFVNGRWRRSQSGEPMDVGLMLWRIQRQRAESADSNDLVLACGIPMAQLR